MIPYNASLKDKKNTKQPKHIYDSFAKFCISVSLILNIMSA